MVESFGWRGRFVFTGEAIRRRIFPSDALERIGARGEAPHSIAGTPAIKLFRNTNQISTTCRSRAMLGYHLFPISFSRIVVARLLEYLSPLQPDELDAKKDRPFLLLNTRKRIGDR